MTDQRGMTTIEAILIAEIVYLLYVFARLTAANWKGLL